MGKSKKKGKDKKKRKHHTRYSSIPQHKRVGKELIPVYANPDGTVGTWRIAPEQVWTLRNTFTF